MKNSNFSAFTRCPTWMAAGLILIFSLSGRADDYLGADAVLEQALSTNSTPKTAKQLTPQQQLRLDLSQFQTNAARLAPSEAAAQWLKLADRFAKTSNTMVDYMSSVGNGSQPLQASDLVAALPPPAAWQELAEQVDARPAGKGAEALRELGLRLLAHTLTGDTTRRKEDLTAMQSLAAKADASQLMRLNSLFEQLNRSMLALLTDPDAIIASLEQQMAAQSANGDSGGGSLEIPDLVTLVGPQKAEAFLRTALVQYNGQLQINPSTRTQQLAQKLALELVDKLKKPQWSLVNSLDAVDLYEAMDKRFTAPKLQVPTTSSLALPPVLPNDSSGMGGFGKQNARLYYFLGLIAKGAVSNAVVAAKQIGRDRSGFNGDGGIYFPDQIIREMEQAGYTHQLSDFFHEQLSQDPELPFWDEYVTEAAHAGETAEMLKLVRTTAARSDLSDGLRFRLRRTLCDALLADDQVEAGVAELQPLLQDTNATPAGSSAFGSENDRGSLALQMAKIGHLLNHTNWLDEGLTIAKYSALHSENDNSGYWADSTVISVADFLRQIGRGPEAEKLLANKLAQTAQKLRGNGAGSTMVSALAAPMLTELVRIYSEAGRQEDVLKLFDQAPYWGGKDLAQVSSGFNQFAMGISDLGHNQVTVPVGYYAANALAASGRTAEARKILDALLNQSPGCDRLYELLLKLDDQNTLSELDALFSRDQFEERPLIWKAHWLRLHNQLSAAEEAARKAISVDPSDGDEGPGDRLRAYAELADIRAARGDEKEASTLRGAVAAIRESELADQFHGAGLLKHAIDLYTDSLNKFADAYCVHARLAVQLSDMGKFDEAAEHYRKAYELMPDSFGRVESHCFGCERAFDGERAQSIAEKVFADLARKTPNKPQVHYLLGYLREEQSRYQEAMDSYRTAVKLDPDYLNAWVKMEEVSSHVIISPDERDSIIFHILQLDPAHHRETPSFELVSDLPMLWKLIADNQKKIPQPPTSLYPLQASAAALEKLPKNSGDGEEWYDMMGTGGNLQMTPINAIAQNGFISATEQLLGNDFQND